MNCLPKDIFIFKDYIERLTCTFGLGVFNNPVALPCQHVYCKGCIEQWLAKNGGCPKCRCKFSKDDLKPQTNFAKMIQSAEVQCSLTGCTWKGRYDMLEHHLLVECKEEMVLCSFGCGIKIKRQLLSEHCGICEFRRVTCSHCNSILPWKKYKVHELFCAMNISKCPQCGIEMLAKDLESHLKDVCEKSNTRCRFYISGGCTFEGTKEGLEAHYTANVSKHLEMLMNTIIEVQKKIEELEKNRRSIKPNPDPTKFIDVNWTNGAKKTFGTTSKSWSFVITSKVIAGNFRARIRISDLNADDQNSWKICMGLLNSAKFQPGNWGRYKNAYGYILGTGQKAANEATSYGQSYKKSDIITIEHNMGKITFYKNSVPQGIAFSDVKGPFFIGAALSDTGHSVEIIDVIEI